MTKDQTSSGRVRRRRRRPRPGLPPGTLEADPSAPRPLVTAIAYGPEGLVEREVTDVPELVGLRREWPVLWVNVAGLGDIDVLTELGEIFGLHRLALEDVVNVNQRAKVEPYGDHYFVIVRMSAPGDGVATEQLSLFLGKDFVLTFQETPGDCLDPVRERLRKGRPRLRNGGPDYLAYAILDAVVDHYFPLLESYGERLEALQLEAMEEPGKQTLQKIYRLRNELLILRRAVWPLREALIALEREQTPLIAQDTRVYLRDCYDHTVQIIDLVESSREMVAGLMDFYLSSVSNRMNEVMKVLAVFASLFIPLSFIAGVYGMNFNPEQSRWNMPELDWAWGYPFALAVMGAVAAALLVFFWRKGWLW